MALRLRSLASPLSSTLRKRYPSTGTPLDPRRENSYEPALLDSSSSSKSDVPPSSSSLLPPLEPSSPSPPPSTRQQDSSRSLDALNATQPASSASETTKDSDRPTSSSSTFPSSSPSSSSANRQLGQATGAPTPSVESRTGSRASSEASSLHPTVPKERESSSGLDRTVDSKTKSGTRTNEEVRMEGARELTIEGSGASTASSGNGKSSESVSLV
ncbi:hypothetical protein BDY24DRAFT_266112 [Mrakia frigida]|uniref:uncharacterized protein n=1 Tax=Mrakia frigida TaxID=29902 RepID=UPI003FCC18D1